MSRSEATLENGETLQLDLIAHGPPARHRVRSELRPAAAPVQPRPSCERRASAPAGVLELAEIGGSETFVHLSSGGLKLVAQVPGVHDLALGEPCELFFDPAELYCFDERGLLLFAPER